MSPVSQPATSEAFVLERVGFAFPGGPEVVAGVTAAVPAGRLTAVLGPNGAGKSVLLSLMAGLRRPLAGRLMLGEKPLVSFGPAALARRIAWVPHHTQGGESFRVHELVALGRVAFGEPRAQVAAAAGRALDFLELRHLATAEAGTLSAGQRRRVMLARALAQLDGRADGILLLDEPDANLDPAQAVFLFRKLRLLAEQGMTVVAVVHDLHLAAEFAQTVWLMKEGALLAVGDAQEVLAQDALSRTYGVAVAPGPGWKVG